MTKTEKFLTFALSVVSGIAIAYIRETKHLERLNRLQAEQIERLKEYIEWTEEDHSTVYTRKC
jgi:DNA-directed RNA polymerase specialized sigma subunit